jgi:hypothetical protein
VLSALVAAEATHSASPTVGARASARARTSTDAHAARACELWQRSELRLFALRCVAKHIDPTNDEVGALLSAACAPPTHHSVRRAAIDCFVPLAAWLHAHPVSLCFALNMLLQSIDRDVPRDAIEFLDTHYCLGTHAGGAMQDPRVMDGSAASVAFRKLCTRSARALGVASPPLLPSLASAAGECSFIYRYILRESCSQFDSLPLTSLTILPSLASTAAPATVSGVIALHVQLPLFSGLAAVASHCTDPTPAATLHGTTTPMLEVLSRAAAAVACGEGRDAAALALMRVASTLAAVLGAWEHGESGAAWLTNSWPTLAGALRTGALPPLPASPVSLQCTLRRRGEAL